MCLQIPWGGHVKMNIPEPQPPEILRLVLGSLHCDSDRSLDNILRKHVLVNFSHFTKRMWRHREVKEAAVSFILEECKLQLREWKLEVGLGIQPRTESHEDLPQWVEEGRSCNGKEESLCLFIDSCVPSVGSSAFHWHMPLHPGLVRFCPASSYQVSVDDTRLFQVGHALTYVQTHAQQGLCGKEPPLATQVIWQAAVFHELKHQADGGLFQAYSIQLD